MSTRSKLSNRKPGTPRLPIRNHAMVPAAAAKPPEAQRSAGTGSGLAPGIASKVAANVLRAAAPTQGPMPELTQRFNLSEERLLTVKEAAFRLVKSPCTIRSWLHTGRLRGWQPGGGHCSMMVSEASLEEMLIQPLGFRLLQRV